MSIITDRKRAAGLGAGGSAAHHHWQILVTSISLVFLVPLAIFTIGCAMGGTHEEVAAYFSRPFPVIIMALTFIVGIFHLKLEAQAAIEDYIGGIKRKLTLIAMTSFCFVLATTGLFALLKLALQ